MIQKCKFRDHLLLIVRQELCVGAIVNIIVKCNLIVKVKCYFSAIYL